MTKPIGSLTSGTTLGPYEIQGPLGAGGMGEVYKARDTRLDRTVAIKVLPEHVAADPDLKQRFEREAKTVAALSHPHICPVFDVGSQDGIDFLVMEYLDGETLAQRLGKGALPLDQALQIAIQIADALDKAHRQGIVHRDLKPGNIMLTKAGAKLLDFGLAKLKPGGAAPGMTALPTQSANLTGEGTILGTLQYMAPEQLEGEEADARTDLFAFGAVVYEMVTGQRAFVAKSQASLIAAILDREPPPMSAMQELAPQVLDRVARKCLAKAPERRWHSAHDLHDELVWIAEGASVVDATPAGDSAEVVGTRSARESRLRTGAWAVGAAVMASVATWVTLRPAPPSPAAITRFAVTTQADGALVVSGLFPDVAISRDGTRVVYRGGGEAGVGTRQLLVRQLDQLEAVAVRGTEGGGSPFFSPNGEWIAFWGADGLQKVSTFGGPPVGLVPYDGPPFRGAWGPDDTIVYASAATGGLRRVPAAGGQPEQLTTSEDGAVHGWPEFLPGGQAVLFTRGIPLDPGIAAVTIDSGEVVDILPGGSDPRFVAPGHLVYGADGSLWAVPFDPDRLTVTGSPVPLVEEVLAKRTGAVDFDVSETGSLVYVAGGGQGAGGRTLLWVDRAGRQEPVEASQRATTAIRMSRPTGCGSPSTTVRTSGRTTSGGGR